MLMSNNYELVFYIQQIGILLYPYSRMCQINAQIYKFICLQMTQNSFKNNFFLFLFSFTIVAVLWMNFLCLRDLRMLSLVLGSRITDAAVTAIVSCYTSLELLDLSG